jgi:aerobic carbon-monoxide dehydrogenase small subunit
MSKVKDSNLTEIQTTQEETTINITLKINNKNYKVDVKPTDTLLFVLREKLNLTGTKYGCGEGECGACSVIIDGILVNSCLFLAVQTQNKEILTIEGYENDEIIKKIQEAFIAKGAVQCGYCTPGMIMAAKALLMKNPNPTIDEIREAISGNLCRCTGYTKIVDAISSIKDLA